MYNIRARQLSNQRHSPQLFNPLHLILHLQYVVLAIDDQKGPDSNYYPCRTKHTEPSIHPFSVALIQEWERILTECWKRWDPKHRLLLDLSYEIESCKLLLNVINTQWYFYLPQSLFKKLRTNFIYNIQINNSISLLSIENAIFIFLSF